MQVFSELNSRRIADVNVFAEITKSPIFCGILALTVAVQALFIEAVGSTVVGPAIGFVSQNTKEWITAIILGVIILPVGFFVRLLPLEWFPGMTDEESNAKAMAASKAAVLAAQARVDAAEQAIDMGTPRPSEERRSLGLGAIGESLVASRLHSRQSRLSDASSSTVEGPPSKSFKIFAHAVIAAGRLKNTATHGGVKSAEEA